MLEGAGREETPLVPALRALVRVERTVDAALRALGRLAKRVRGEPLEVLVVLDWRLGDEVMALPVYEAIAAARPGARVVARVRYPELLAGNPHVAAVNPPTCRPDVILDLKGEEPGEARHRTLARRAGLRADALAATAPRVYLDDAEREAPFAELARLKHPRIAIQCGATQACKSWGRARWRELGEMLAREGASVIEVGLRGQAIGAGLDLTGRTGVRALARVLAGCDLVVGDDSGPLHLALAVGTPALGVFGATDPALLYPQPQQLPPRAARFTAVVTPAACRFCWPRRTLAYPTGVCPLARHECMEAISVESVGARVRSLVAMPDAGRPGVAV